MPPNEDFAPGPEPHRQPPSPYHNVPVGSIYPSNPGAPPPPPNADDSQQIAGNVTLPVPEEEPKTPVARWYRRLSTIGILLLAPLIAWLISTFALQSYQVSGQSMESTLQNRDRLIVDKLPRSWARLTHHPYIPKRGDIIIFNANSILNFGGAPEQLIKRVIALPGERVVVKNNKVTVYNDANPKGFNPDESGLYVINHKVTTHDVDYNIDSGQVFVLGDNRPNSEDSRYFGPISASDIVGKLSLRIMPFNKIDRF